MKRFSTSYGRFVASRPWYALATVFAITCLAVFGLSLTADQAAEQDAFLPSSSELVAATESLATGFPESSALEAIQVVMRGNVLTPQGAADAFAVTEVAATSDALSSFVVVSRPAISPGHVLKQILAGPEGDPSAIDLARVSQADIDEALADGRAGGSRALLESLIARDENGDPIGGIGAITVNANDDLDGLIDAQVAVDREVQTTDLRELDTARTLSNGKNITESNETSASSLAVLMAIAFTVIALLLAVFYRQATDVVFSVASLLLTIVWALGFQGLLGPEGLGVIGAPTFLSTIVPVMMIGLCVDYGIQGTSRYREALAGGRDAADAISESVAAVMLPLGLAGGTTIISFLTNLFGDISGLGDFGVVAGAGIASGLVIFLTAVPALRILVDRRRQAAGKALTTRSLDRAIPGAGTLVGNVGAVAVRRPGLILVAAGILTLALGGAATQLESTFDSNDFLADGTETKEDVVFVQDFLGANTEPVTVLIEANVANERTARNLIELSIALEDPDRRPDAVSGGVTASVGEVFESVSPSIQGQVLTAFTPDPLSPLIIEDAAIKEGLDLLQAADPSAFDAVVSYGVDGQPDRTILQFNAFTGDVERTRQLIEDIDSLWFGDDDEITTIANGITAIEVTDSLTNSQGTSIALTIVAAIIVLVLFFWATEFRPMLALLSVLPILLVLTWVLGTMVILGYSYNVITALITALSIGIGVDYTIHITHRFLDEREHGAATIAEAIDTTMRTTGGALIGSAITTALGFAVLVFSPIPPMGQFGLLTAITVGYSLIAAIVVLPPMLVVWAAYHDWRSRYEPAPG